MVAYPSAVAPVLFNRHAVGVFATNSIFYRPIGVLFIRRVGSPGSNNAIAHVQLLLQGYLLKIYFPSPKVAYLLLKHTVKPSPILPYIVNQLPFETITIRLRLRIGRVLPGIANLRFRHGGKPFISAEVFLGRAVRPTTLITFARLATLGLYG
jgi:hypothetical protein